MSQYMKQLYFFSFFFHVQIQLHLKKNSLGFCTFVKKNIVRTNGFLAFAMF